MPRLLGRLACPNSGQGALAAGMLGCLLRLLLF